MDLSLFVTDRADLRDSFANLLISSVALEKMRSETRGCLESVMQVELDLIRLRL